MSAGAEPMSTPASSWTAPAEAAPVVNQPASQVSDAEVTALDWVRAKPARDNSAPLSASDVFEASTPKDEPSQPIAAKSSYQSEPTPAPVAHQSPYTTPHAPYHEAPASTPAPVFAPASDLKETLQESGLVWIETDPSKAQVVAAEPAESIVQRAPRPKRPPPEGLNEPIQQVETRK
jgi:hypothetical protein